MIQLFCPPEKCEATELLLSEPLALNRVRTPGGCLMDWKNSGGEIRSTF
jgi:hypothetical protein